MMIVSSTAIPEVHGIGRERFESAIVPRGQPVVLRGLVADWVAVQHGRASPEAICRYLIERDNGTPVDAIMLAAEEKGRIFYNAAMDGFNFLRNRLPVSRVIEQIARYSAFESPPSVAVQSALIS
ncbi:MAG TPA: cupin-like domain-containing protein, partial [Burkholderiales bacterium]|nr:cupin-like domain-containing protein [Burkholderiales bacterium]